MGTSKRPTSPDEWRSRWAAKTGIPVALVGAFAALLTCSSADPPSTPAPGLHRVGDASPEDTLPVLFRLRTDDAGMEALIAEQLAASSRGEVIDYPTPAGLGTRFGASDATVAKIKAILGKYDVETAIDATHTFVDTVMNASQLKSVLGSTLGKYRITGCNAGDFLMADSIPQIHGELSETVGAVLGLRKRPPVCLLSQSAETVPAPVAPPPASACAHCEPSGVPEGNCGVTNTGYFTPAQLNTAYGASFLHELGYRGGGTRAALLSIGTKPAVFTQFLGCFPEYFDQQVSVDYHFDVDDVPFSQEGQMDLQALVWAAPHVEHVDYYQGGTDPGDFARATVHMLSQPELPDVFTVSFGFCASAIDVGEIPQITSAEWDAYRAAVRNAAATGITLFFGSADNGSSCIPVPACMPSVTAVGGTSLLLGGDNHIAQEEVWNTTLDPRAYTRTVATAGGGGGACDMRYVSPAAYQANTPGISSADAGVRLIPDVSAYAASLPGVAVYIADRQGASWFSGNGTSFATPYTAGASLLLAQALKQTENGRLGYLNPRLYAAARANYSQYFRDVTAVGNYLGSEYPAPPPNASDCCDADVHYDKASGLGSIRFEQLVFYLLGE